MPASDQPAHFSRIHRGPFRRFGFDRGHQPQTILGVNMWHAMHLGMADPPGDRPRLQRELDHLQRLGVNNLRIMASGEGPAGQPWRVTPPLQPAPGQYDPRVLDGLDYAIAEIAARDMQAVLVLNNFWEWSGGMAAYVAWATGEAIPYPRDDRYEDFLAYAKRFYTLPECRRWARDHIAAIVHRDNPCTGRAYRDEPAIFSWQLANEPRHYPLEWIAETAGYIRSLDPHHMISTGSEGSVGGDFRATHADESIDYATVHIWPQNWGWYDPDRPETYEAAEAKARAYLAEHIAGAAELGKPLVLEEFGLPRDGATEAERYDPASPTTIRNRFFAAMYAEVERSIEANGPLRGSNLWAWTGEGRAGDALIGDPWHEPPGWYSVYATDAETLELLEKHRALEITIVEVRYLAFPVANYESWVEYCFTNGLGECKWADNPFDNMEPATLARYWTRLWKNPAALRDRFTLEQIRIGLLFVFRNSEWWCDLLQPPLPEVERVRCIQVLLKLHTDLLDKLPVQIPQIGHDFNALYSFDSIDQSIFLLLDHWAIGADEYTPVGQAKAALIRSILVTCRSPNCQAGALCALSSYASNTDWMPRTLERFLKRPDVEPRVRQYAREIRPDEIGPHFI